MDLNALLHNQILMIGIIGAVLTIAGIILTKEKLFAVGVKLGAKLNRLIGKKNAERVEESLQQVLNGMKADNEAPNDSSKKMR